ncbi:hypothetical protein GCM10009549_31040 [Streptomyces thermoalcalitolerans]|uniref:SMP-30/Gluconolactonase/LRE-like region domain-containing protein n=1 Tax=Streptomyces thermoalcalitolerans TaxID=65605 RepID=A0ABN1NRX5_9ACTN
MQEVTAGYAGGIFNGPKLRRVYLSDPQHSVPFIGSKDMLVADLGGVPRIRKRDAESRQPHYLKLEAGMTLIACSGFNAGRRAYARPDMAPFGSLGSVRRSGCDRKGAGVVPRPFRNRCRLTGSPS